MNKISNAIKCKNCCQLLKSPVLLPCGHSICAYHVSKTSQAVIKCSKCGVDHSIPKSGFYQNEDLAEIIDSKIDQIDFGNVYYEAKMSCDRLQGIIDQTNSFVADFSGLINEKIWELKRAVQIKADEIKLKIDRKMSSLFTMLDEYENDCRAKLNDYELERVLLLLYTNEIQIRLNYWNGVLNELVFNEPAWKVIIRECNVECRKLETFLKQFERKLLLFDRFGEMTDVLEKFSSLLL